MSESSYLLLNVLPHPRFFVDIPKASSGKVSAGLSVGRLLDLGTDGPEHRTEAALAAGKRQDDVDARVGDDDDGIGLDFAAVVEKRDLLQRKTLDIKIKYFIYLYVKFKLIRIAG